MKKTFVFLIGMVLLVNIFFANSNEIIFTDDASMNKAYDIMWQGNESELSIYIRYLECKIDKNLKLIKKLEKEVKNINNREYIIRGK